MCMWYIIIEWVTYWNSGVSELNYVIAFCVPNHHFRSDLPAVIGTVSATYFKDSSDNFTYDMQAAAHYPYTVDTGVCCGPQYKVLTEIWESQRIQQLELWPTDLAPLTTVCACVLSESPCSCIVKLSFDRWYLLGGWDTRFRWWFVGSGCRLCWVWPPICSGLQRQCQAEGGTFWQNQKSWAVHQVLNLLSSSGSGRIGWIEEEWCRIEEGWAEKTWPVNAYNFKVEIC